MMELLGEFQKVTISFLHRQHLLGGRFGPPDYKAARAEDLRVPRDLSTLTAPQVALSFYCDLVPCGS